MKKYKKIINNSLIFAIGNLGSKLIQFVLVPLYTYTLTKSEFGKVDLITNVVNLIGVVLTLDIADALFRFAMDERKNKDNVFSTGIILAFGTLCLGFLFVPLLHGLSGDYPVVLSYLFLVFFILFTCISNYVRAIGFSKLFAISGAISTFVTGFANIILLIQFKLGMTGYLVSLILANFIASLFLLLTTKVWKKFSWKKFDRMLLKEMVFYSVPLIPNSIAWWLNSSSDRFFIVIFLGATANGLYAVANKIPSLITILSTVFMQSWQLSTVEEYNSKDRKEFFSNVFKYFTNLIFSVSIIILLVIRPLLKVSISPAFYNSWKVVPLLILAVIYSSIASFLGTMYTASKKTVPIMVTTILGALTNIVLTILLVPLLGLNGAAIANIFSFFLVIIMRLKDMYKFNVLNLDLKNEIFNHLLFFLTLFYLFIVTSLPLKIILSSVIFVLCLMKNKNIIINLYKLLRGNHL